MFDYWTASREVITTAKKILAHFSLNSYTGYNETQNNYCFDKLPRHTCTVWVQLLAIQ